MAEETTVDAYGESEQISGWSYMLDEHLAVPFETVVLGVAVIVERLDLRDDLQIVAICRRGPPGDRDWGTAVADTQAGRRRVGRGLPTLAKGLVSAS
jgi:hypothetical protein